MIEYLKKEELVKYLKKKNEFLTEKIAKIKQSKKGSTQNAEEQLRYNNELLKKHNQ